MSEIITISAETEVEARARYAFEQESRPGQWSRVLRADVFKIARFNVVPSADMVYSDGYAESGSGADVFVMVVEFWV